MLVEGIKLLLEKFLEKNSSSGLVKFYFTCEIIVTFNYLKLMLNSCLEITQQESSIKFILFGNYTWIKILRTLEILPSIVRLSAYTFMFCIKTRSLIPFLFQPEHFIPISLSRTYVYLNQLNFFEWLFYTVKFYTRFFINSL